MMKSRSTVWFFSVLLACGAVNALAETPASLKHNPFARPPSNSSVIRGESSILSDSPEPTINLVATLVSSQGKLANVAGRIMRPGDEVEEIRLVEVYEDRAVFLQSGRNVTVYVKPKVEEEDE